MNTLSAAGLADLAGTTAAEVQRLVDLGILVARDGTGPFLETDVPKVRLATAQQIVRAGWKVRVTNAKRVVRRKGRLESDESCGPPLADEGS